MAKPTPDRRWSSTLLPIQKKVYPARTSSSWDVPAKRVSLRAAMSMLCLRNASETRAVFRSGVESLSWRVLTFQEPRLTRLQVLFLFNLLLFGLRSWITRQLQRAAKLAKSKQFLGRLLLPPPQIGESSATSKQTCIVPIGGHEQHNCSGFCARTAITRWSPLLERQLETSSNILYLSPSP